METSIVASPPIPAPSKPPPDTEKIKRKLLQYGVYPTPKTVHTLRKKELQKSLRKSKKLFSKETENSPLAESQKRALDEKSHFQTLRREYRDFNKMINAKSTDSNVGLMVGKPWERLEKTGLKDLSDLSKVYASEKLKVDFLRDLGYMFDERKRDELRWVLDDDVEVEEGWLDTGRQTWARPKRRGGETEAIRFLVDRLSAKELNAKDWKFGRMMKQSELQFTEAQLLKIVGRLSIKGQWKTALSVVEWVYSNKEHKHFKSRFVYTKLLSVLGKARRPHEALHIFNLMRGDFLIYPDMAAYHSIAVTLGQSGLLKELVKIIEIMKRKPNEIKHMRCKNWDPIMEPDLVIYNAVLNACTSTRQWKGVSWVFQQLRSSGLRPNGASYGLAMEVMLESGNYDLVHEFFQKMRKSGETPKAITYKVLVRTFWKEGKVGEAVEAVRNMEQRGVVGTVCVYYELACCLCNNGRWQDAMKEVEKLKNLPRAKPLEVTFTGMIMSAMDGGYVDECRSIFEKMKDHCTPNIGTINAMLKVYGRMDMFSEAKELFEKTKKANSGSKICIDERGGTVLAPDVYTYSLMLNVSANAHQWEYFEHVYKDMALCGYKLDQKKYPLLLVEASRAGKCHLLEHAFDTTLEAGEIPNLSFFTEMVCQATVQHNYERALTLINALALAPYQVTEKQWTEIFAKNGYRISKDCLEKLSDVLINSPITEEPTVLNLTKSLHSLFKSGDLSVLSNGFLNKSNFDVSNEKSNIIEEINEGNISKTMVGGNPKAGRDRSSNISDITFNVSSIKYGVEAKDGTIEMISTKTEDLAAISNHSSKRKKSKNDDDDDDWELDIRIDNVGASNQLHCPSADEILEAWKEDMIKDGSFFTWQL